MDWDTWVSMSASTPPAAKPAATQIPVTTVTPSDAPTHRAHPRLLTGQGRRLAGCLVAGPDDDSPRLTCEGRVATNPITFGDVGGY